MKKLRGNPLRCFRVEVRPSVNHPDILNAFQAILAMSASGHAAPEYLVGVTYSPQKYIKEGETGTHLNPGLYFLIAYNDLEEMAFTSGKYFLFRVEMGRWLQSYFGVETPIWDMAQFDTKVGSPQNNLEDLHERGFSYEKLWNFLSNK